MKGKAVKSEKPSQPSVSSSKPADLQQFQQSLEISRALPTLGAAFEEMFIHPRDQQPIDQFRGILGNSDAVQIQGQIADLKNRNSGLEKQLEDLRKQASVQRKPGAAPRKLKK